MRAFSSSSAALLLTGASGAVAAPARDCAASDRNLLVRSHALCSSLTHVDTPWCGTLWSNVTAKHDWPNQAIYMLDLVRALYANDTCLTTARAQATVQWLESPQMVDPNLGPHNFMWTYLVFQPQYYDMPRKSGERIESPDTLGRKCWAFAYLQQFWLPELLERALATAGLTMQTFIATFNRAIPLTLRLCEEVMANW